MQTSFLGEKGNADRIAQSTAFSPQSSCCAWSFRKCQVAKYKLRGWQDRGWAPSTGVSRDFDTLGFKELTVLWHFCEPCVLATRRKEPRFSVHRFLTLPELSDVMEPADPCPAWTSAPGYGSSIPLKLLLASSGPLQHPEPSFPESTVDQPSLPMEGQHLYGSPEYYFSGRAQNTVPLGLQNAEPYPPCRW